MKISELKSPYKELAEMRRTDKDQNILSAAFCWNKSPEGFEFWRNVNHKVNSEIPTESLEELYEKGFLKWSNGKEQPKKSEEEYVLGKVYELFSPGTNWHKAELLADLGERFSPRFIAKPLTAIANVWACYREIREVEEVDFEKDEVDYSVVLPPIESLVLQRIGEALNERIDELKSRIEKDKEQIKWIKSILKGEL